MTPTPLQPVPDESPATEVITGPSPHLNATSREDRRAQWIADGGDPAAFAVEDGKQMAAELVAAYGPPLTGDETDGDSGEVHTRGEFVNGLGWSCVECDTFYCPVVNSDDPAQAWRCSSCGRPRAECRPPDNPFLSCCSACAANDGDLHYSAAPQPADNAHTGER